MISIIIPTLNEEKVIKTATEQFKALTKIAHEVIVSDENSSDRTREFAEPYARVVVNDTGMRKNIPWGKNFGAAHASGDILFFMDADCTIPDPNAFFTRVLDAFGSDPKLVALTGSIVVLPQFATIADRIVFALMNTWFRILNNVFRYGMAGGEFQVIRRSAYEALGGYDDSLFAGEDVEFFRRLSKIGRTRFFPELIMYHTGRRAHKVGWPRLLFSWWKNWVGVTFKNKSDSTEWTVIR